MRSLGISALQGGEVQQRPFEPATYARQVEPVWHFYGWLSCQLLFISNHGTRRPGLGEFPNWAFQEL